MRGGGDGPPMLPAHLTGIHLLIPTFPLARPVHDSGPVTHLLKSLTRAGPHHDTPFLVASRYLTFPSLCDPPLDPFVWTVIASHRSSPLS